MAQNAQSQQLGSKESSLFRQIVKNYESKQYKKGLKAADQILRKHPNHGETQAMRALLLNSLGQTEEAFTLAKLALKNDMKSNTCWHVYGLLWRSAKNFEEAIKAYKFALRLQPESPQILRDLAMLQVQMRDYAGYVQSRKLMLQSKSSLRQNWTAMAVAHHLAGDLKAAEQVLTTYEETLKQTPPKADVEHAEAVLYKNRIIAEMGETERALDHLEAVKKSTLDRTAVMELRARYLLQLGRKEEAEKAYRALLDRNAENSEYYAGLEQAIGVSRDDKQAVKELYGSLAQKHDRIDAARRIPLDFLEGDDFRTAADSYLRAALQKGVPSLFSNIKALYWDEAKRKTVEELVESYVSSKPVNGTNGTQTNGDHADRFQESALFFLAQHYNYKLSRNLPKAMQYVEQLIELSPKTYDYHMTKARVLKHYGNPAEAAKVMNYARELDLKDRYINTKCAKYQLRNDENDNALSTMSKFTRNETVGGTLGDLTEMQCLWYLSEDGEAYVRQGKFGLALKRFHTIFNIFEVWQEDQFDFHSFSLRKFQIRAYMDMMRWEDQLREHPFFARGAIDAIKVYIKLHDKPDLATDGLPPDFAELDDNERKKVLKKAKKEEERLEKEDAEKRDADKRAAAKKANAESEPKPIDKDPRGTKLLETKEPLEVALTFLQPLLEFGDDNAEAQHVGFEIYIRRKKYYLALKCLLAAFKLNSSDPEAHEQTIRFRTTLKDLPASDATAVIDLANSSLPAPYNDPSTSLISLNDTFLSSHTSDAPSVYAVARSRQFLEPKSRPENESLVLETLVSCPDMSLDNALAGIYVLKELGSAKDVVENFAKKASQKWPEATILGREAAR